MERKAVNDMFVVLSDVWLDDEEVIRIHTLCSFFYFHFNHFVECVSFCLPDYGKVERSSGGV